MSPFTSSNMLIFCISHKTCYSFFFSRHPTTLATSLRCPTYCFPNYQFTALSVLNFGDPRYLHKVAFCANEHSEPTIHPYCSPLCDTREHEVKLVGKNLASCSCRNMLERANCVCFIFACFNHKVGPRPPSNPKQSPKQ